MGNVIICRTLAVRDLFPLSVFTRRFNWRVVTIFLLHLLQNKENHLHATEYYSPPRCSDSLPWPNKNKSPPAPPAPAPAPQFKLKLAAKAAFCAACSFIIFFYSCPTEAASFSQAVSCFAAISCLYLCREACLTWRAAPDPFAAATAAAAATDVGSDSWYNVGNEEKCLNKILLFSSL